MWRQSHPDSPKPTPFSKTQEKRWQIGGTLSGESDAEAQRWAGRRIARERELLMGRDRRAIASEREMSDSAERERDEDQGGETRELVGGEKNQRRRSNLGILCWEGRKTRVENKLKWGFCSKGDFNIIFFLAGFQKLKTHYSPPQLHMDLQLGSGANSGKRVGRPRLFAQKNHSLLSPPNTQKKKLLSLSLCNKKKKKKKKMMKNLYRKKKSSRGKIHPSPSPSHTSTHSLSGLNLLPSAILTIVSVLSVDDQEVLAYLIHCSITTTTTTTNPSTKKCNKPTFNCGCFDCYTIFWIRWDSSPNRHLIHQAIEAFEDHLSPSDHPSDKAHKSKPMNLSVSADKSVPDSVPGSPESEPSEHVPPATSTSTSDDAVADSARQCSNAEHEPTGNRLQPVASVQEQRGLVRKVWPEVWGLFNSRLWSLRNPSV